VASVHTTLSEHHHSTLAACARDPAPFVRRQALAGIAHLLTHDHIKVSGPLVLQLVPVVADADAETAAFARYVFSSVIAQKDADVVARSFVDAIFSLNGESFAAYNAHARVSRQSRVRLALAGPQAASQRVAALAFLASLLPARRRFEAFSRLCDTVFVPLASAAAGELVCPKSLADALSVVSTDVLGVLALASGSGVTDAHQQTNADTADVIAALVRRFLSARLLVTLGSLHATLAAGRATQQSACIEAAHAVVAALGVSPSSPSWAEEVRVLGASPQLVSAMAAETVFATGVGACPPAGSAVTPAPAGRPTSVPPPTGRSVRFAMDLGPASPAAGPTPAVPGRKRSRLSGAN
jgi:hypothetical protein